MKTYWVYLLRCADHSYYVGITSRLEFRVAQHNAGEYRGCYTHRRRPVELAYAQEFADVEEAIAAEKQLKGWSRAKKTALIAGNWNEIRRLANHPSTSSG